MPVKAQGPEDPRLALLPRQGPLGTASYSWPLLPPSPPPRVSRRSPCLTRFQLGP